MGVYVQGHRRCVAELLGELDDRSALLADQQGGERVSQIVRARAAQASSSRGGMEVSSLRLMLGSTPATTLMYRTPDGKVQEFLFSRR